MTPLFHLPPDLALALAAPGPDGAVALDALADEERARLETFGHAERRRGFALGRTALRGLLAPRLGCAPPDVPLDVAADGALDVRGHPFSVSLAHAGRGADARAVAAAGLRPVGVDLERVGPRRPDLWRRLLAPDEVDVLDVLGGPTDEAQTMLWALKEAVLKGERTGLRQSARSVRLTPDGDGRALARTARGDWRLAYGFFEAYAVVLAWQSVGAPGLEE